MIVVIGGMKGGSGKTTISTNLTVLRARAGKKVLLVDADEQRSAYDWSLQRNTGLANLEFPSFVTVCMSGKNIYCNLIKMRSDYDDIIVDTGGRDTTSQRSALCCADKFLMPFKPSSVDIWTVGPVQRIIDECTNNDLKSYAVICQADPTGKDNYEALTILQEYQDITCLSCMIGNRKAFRNAATKGLGVIELDVLDQKACNEMQDLYNAIFL